MYFFEPDGSSDEYHLVAASDVTEVLDWAEANAGDRTYVVYVFADFGPRGEERSLFRLLGRDPNEAP